MEIFYTNEGIKLFGIGLVALLFSILLYTGKVRMNRIRLSIPNAYSSEENWNKINRYGGKVLILWSVVISVTGLILSPFSSGTIININGIVLSVIIPIIKIYFYAKKI